MSPSKQWWVPVNQTRAATIATVALKNLGRLNHINGLFLHKYLLLNRKSASTESALKRVQVEIGRIESLHALERGVGILRSDCASF